jgi:hypothetical protein
MKATVLSSVLLLVVPALGAAASLQLEGAQDSVFCAQVLELIRKNMGDGNQLNVEAKPFSHIKWEPAVIAGTGPKTRRCSSLDKALVDLDNDGRKDLVVKATFCMKGAPSDSLYVFPADSQVLERASWQDLAPLLATANKFERTGGRYTLTAIPMPASSERARAALHGVFTVQPFRVGEKTYVALTDGRGEWTVVATYRGGERFDDQCYLRSGGRS